MSAFDSSAFDSAVFATDVEGGAGTTLELVPGTGSLVVTGLAPTLAQTTTRTLAAGTGGIQATGLAPTVTQSNVSTTTLEASPAGMVVTGLAPEVTQSNYTTSTLPVAAGTLAVQGLAPTIEQTANQELAPATQALAVSGLAPEVVRTGLPLDARYARPDGLISAGPWTPSEGTSLAAMLADESNDSFIRTEEPGNCEIPLGAVAAPPAGYAHRFSYSLRSDNGSSVIARLKQGSTVIGEWRHDGLPAVFTVFHQTLTAEQRGLVTDYQDLRMEMEAL